MISAALLVVCIILYTMYGVASLAYVIIDEIKTNGDLKGFKLTGVEYISMFGIVLAGPIVGLLIIRDNNK